MSGPRALRQRVSARRPTGGTPEQIVALIKSDMANCAKAIRDSGARPD
jgi:hypothetical protein